jgi:hypothetical protein
VWVDVEVDGGGGGGAAGGDAGLGIPTLRCATAVKLVARTRQRTKVVHDETTIFFIFVTPKEMIDE